jgi:predicted CopG family antitoxin
MMRDMTWKTLTLDEEAYKLLKKAKQPRESFGDVVRRVFAAKDEPDPSDLVDELFHDFGGKGLMKPAARRRAIAAQSKPTRSNRPARAV